VILLKKITIVHFVNGLNNGGVERVILNYFKYINLEKYDLHVITQGESDEKCLEEFKKMNFHIHTVTKKSESILKNIKDIYKILKIYNVDIVHAHMTVTNMFPLIIAKICGIKTRINHAHLSYEKMSYLKRCMCIIGMLFSTHYFACGRKVAISVFGKQKVNNNRVIILNNAIELERFQFKPEVRNNVRKELGINNKFVVGNIGRFVHQKNHDFLIDVFYEILKYKNNAYLLLIGTGELEDKIKNKVIKLGIENNVIFLGTQNEVEKFYQAMDVFLLPSIYEGLAVVLVEAQASGVKCVASNSITKEAALTSKVSFLPLDNKSLWVNETLKDNYLIRENCNDQITFKGYNIKYEAVKLNDFYSNIVGR
jgi:glycosyltransferase EpsF